MKTTNNETQRFDEIEALRKKLRPIEFVPHRTVITHPTKYSKGKAQLKNPVKTPAYNKVTRIIDIPNTYQGKTSSNRVTLTFLDRTEVTEDEFINLVHFAKQLQTEKDGE